MNQRNSTPPIAPKKPTKLMKHNHTRIDDYFWLRQKEDKAVLAYLEAENAYTNSQTEHLNALQEKIYTEMVQRIQETDSTVPYKMGTIYYYSRTVAGLQYKIHCRKINSLEAEEEILLDENKEAEGKAYFKVGAIKMSPNQQLMAYAVDFEGGEIYKIVIKDVASKRIVDEIPHTSANFEWGNDNQTLFYTIQNKAWRPFKAKRHQLGHPVTQDVEIFHEPDELFVVYLSKTKDDAFLFLVMGSIESSEIHYLDANTPQAAFKMFAPRQKGIDYDLDHRQGAFYIRTNEDAINFKLMKTAVSQPSRDAWQTVVPHDPDKLLQAVELFDEHMVIYGRFDGLRVIDIYPFNGESSHQIRFPEPVYDVNSGINPTPHTNQLRLVYSSMTTSDTTYDYNMSDQSWTLLKQEPVLGGYDQSNYVSERHFATAADGTKVPISLVYRKGLVQNGQNPCLLYGYGSYGASMPPSFNQKILSLVDRGFVYAIAHIRGGQEMGRQWYKDGKFLAKKNTFTDFIDCAKYLIKNQFTSSEKLAINGRSAGGLLMGAVTVMAPELFAVVVAGVPFVDVVTTMLDESIPLTVGEYEEWGNPNDETYYHYMLSYSPYDNTIAQDYPHILVTAGLNDPRVQYWEPAKWVARLRDVKTNDNKLLFKIHMGAGHFSSSGRYDYLKDVAFEYAFILDCLQMTDS